LIVTVQVPASWFPELAFVAPAVAITPPPTAITARTDAIAAVNFVLLLIPTPFGSGAHPLRRAYARPQNGSRSDFVHPRGDQATVEVGGLSVRPDRFQAFAGEVSADLTRREFELIQLLAGREGQVLPREEIYERVWGYAMAHGDCSVDVFVRKLRQKLEKVSPDWRYIHTQFGIGYRLAAEPVDAATVVDQEPALATVS
jgi:DNA-binding winged helix-turn-helix (wHTH) protein